jgi:chromosome segregation ATPase
MEYNGKLYGKIGNKYFDTGYTSVDFDKLTNLHLEHCHEISDLNKQLANLESQHTITLEKLKLTYNSSLEFEKQLSEYKGIAQKESVRADNLQEQLAEKTEALENSENGMLNLIKYKNEIVDQLAESEKLKNMYDRTAKALEMSNDSLKHQLAEKENELVKATEQAKFWYDKANMD